MPDYAKLRDMVSHRLTFDVDNGARIVGYLGGTKPAQGPVQIALLSAVRFFGADGTLLGTCPELSVVPNLLVSVTRDPATSQLTFEYDSGAKVVGAPDSDALAAAGLQTLRDAVIHGANGRVLERHERLVVALHPFGGYRVTEGPGGF
ncbi:MAG TPA: hypothetical protein VGQ83_16570 [Polyangia bacterium]|jgi:hypothetical protein